MTAYPYTLKYTLTLTGKGDKSENGYFPLKAICVQLYYPLTLAYVVLLFYVHDKYLRSCRDGQLT